MASENEFSRDAMPLRENYFQRHLYRWKKIHLAVTCGTHNQAQDEETGRKLLSAILAANVCVKKMPSSLAFMKLFAELMRRAENDIRACLSTYMPADLQEKLAPQPISSLDPMDALRELVEPTSESDDKRRFEILRLLELTIEYAHLANQIGIAPETELEKNWNDFERDKITGFLVSLGLGVDIGKRVLVMYLNPKRRWTCNRICWEEDDANSEALLKRGLVRITKTVYAIARANPEKISDTSALVTKRQKSRIKNDLIYAVIQARQKSCFEAFAKRFRNQQGQFSFPADLFGFRIACFSKKEMDMWADFFNLITIHKRRRVRAVAQRNKNAARKLRLFSHPIFLSGQTRELQYIHIRDLMNILLSTREENHTLYHLRWYGEKDGLFEQMWPYDIYQINWQNAVVHCRCEQHIIGAVAARNQSLLE